MASCSRKNVFFSSCLNGSKRFRSDAHRQHCSEVLETSNKFFSVLHAAVLVNITDYGLFCNVYKIISSKRKKKVLLMRLRLFWISTVEITKICLMKLFLLLFNHCLFNHSKHGCLIIPIISKCDSTYFLFLLDCHPPFWFQRLCQR